MILRVPVLSVVLLTLCACSPSGGVDWCQSGIPTVEDVRDFYSTDDPSAISLGAVLEDSYALTGDYKGDQRPQLLRALNIDPGNVTARQTLLNHCYDFFNDSEREEHCIAGSTEELMRLEPENGFFYFHLSVMAFKRGELSDALTHLQRAAALETVSTRWAEQANEFSAVLSTYTDDGESCAIYLAVNIAAMNLPRYGPIMQMCKDQSNEGDEWRQACINAGFALETRGRELITNSFGASLQKVMYEASGDTQNAQSAEGRGDQFRKVQQEYMEQIEDEIFDPEYPQNWLDMILEHGELQAMKLKLEESA